MPPVQVKIMNCVLDGEEKTLNHSLLHVLRKAMTNASDDGQKMLPLLQLITLARIMISASDDGEQTPPQLLPHVVVRARNSAKRRRLDVTIAAFVCTTES